MTPLSPTNNATSEDSCTAKRKENEVAEEQPSPVEEILPVEHANGHSDETATEPPDEGYYWAEVDQTTIAPSEFLWDDDEREIRQQENLQTLVDEENWDAMLLLLEENPMLSREATVTIYCQGECTPCLPLHAAVARRQPSMDVVEALITMNPSAAQIGDERGGRLPLHMACLKGVTSLTFVRYLCRVYPNALQQQDLFGNTPFHYACQYCSEAVCRFLLDEFPNAAHCCNKKQRLPLHLLAARDWSSDHVVTIQLFERLIELYPQAVTTIDRNGRLPLHWACDMLHPRGDVVCLLVQQYSSGLLVKDKAKQRPLVLAKRLQPKCPTSSRTDGNVVMSFLVECTRKEKRKAMTIDKFFTIKVEDKRKHRGYIYG